MDAYGILNGSGRGGESIEYRRKTGGNLGGRSKTSNKIENQLITGNCDLVKIAGELKKAAVLLPQLKEAQQNLNETDYVKLVELLKKPKTK